MGTIAELPTPKALHSRAQGRERSERTLGTELGEEFNPKGVAQTVEPLSGFRFVGQRLPRVRCATLGFVVLPLRGTDAAGCRISDAAIA